MNFLKIYPTFIALQTTLGQLPPKICMTYEALVNQDESP